MLRIKNKLIFFKIKNDKSNKIFFCLNKNKSYIYSTDGNEMNFRYVNSLDDIQEKIEILDFENSLMTLENDFYLALNIYNTSEKKVINSSMKMKRLYRLLDEKEIAFMSTDIYKQYSHFFNLILGIKSLEYIDKNGSYYFSRINPFEAVFDYKFVKFDEEYVLTNSVLTTCNYEHKISSFALDILLLEQEKKYVIDFFNDFSNAKNIFVGQFLKGIEVEDEKERTTEYYLKNPEMYEQILGIFVISYIDKDKLLLSKLDYYHCQCPFDFKYEISLNDFIESKFELLNDDFYDKIQIILKKLSLRKDTSFVPKFLL